VHPAPARVQGILRGLGLSGEVLELAESARTAADAARACGVEVGQIVKSLVFTADGAPLLVLVSGANQADEGRLAALTGAVIRRADPATVRRATGHAIGGVPPVGHPAPLPALVDVDLLRYDRLVAAAGTPHTVFPLTPAELCRITGGRVVTLRREPPAAASPA
jgi:prolyl-tRNA editing enzyme YbaK/EbsC (Cys-tRNA(Pro) deacylase)